MGPTQRSAKPRHDPLHQQIANDSAIRQKIKKPKREKEVAEELYLDAKTSSRILELAKEQQREINEAYLSFIPSNNISQESSEDEHEVGAGYTSEASLHLSEISENEYENEQLPFDADFALSASELALLSTFMTPEPSKQAHLSALVMQNISTNQTREETKLTASAINPRIVDVYTKLGVLLSRYKSGKLPKAFKIIPSLQNWPEIVMLTNPEAWTANATYEATRMFVSNLKSRLAQRFIQGFLLDKVREDISSSGKLNYHLYMAVKKSLYKPAAFFKGFLLPLCESGSCTLRESAILSSVLTKVSIPLLHSSAALLKLAEMPYTGPNSVFIRVLLDKKYALPFRVVDSLVLHFWRFKDDKREMPVLWHQSLLVFVQRYKNDLTPEQKGAVLEVVRVKGHAGISVEIRRELQASICRGEMSEMQM